MAKKLFKSISMCYNDDDSISIRICPSEKEKEKEDDDEMEMGKMMGMGYEEVKASAKDINEALEKIKGIVGLSGEKGKSPKNIISEYLKG